MLGCAEFCVPGSTLEKKLAVLESHKLWLEMVCVGERDISTLESFCVEVNSVQAYLLHDLSLLSSERTEKVSALNHVKDSIRLAGEVGAKNVLTVPTYGFEYGEESFKKCVSIFREISKFAAEYEIKILIEPLSIERTSFLPSVVEVFRLVKAVDRENVTLMADTCHVYDSGYDVIKTLKEFSGRIAELHLKDSGSKPPGKGSLNFKEIVQACHGALLCLEYSGKNVGRDFEYVLNFMMEKGLI